MIIEYLYLNNWDVGRLLGPDLHPENPPADQLPLAVLQTEDDLHLLAEVRGETGELDLPVGGDRGLEGEDDGVSALAVLLVTGERGPRQPYEMVAR